MNKSFEYKIRNNYFILKNPFELGHSSIYAVDFIANLKQQRVK